MKVDRHGMMSRCAVLTVMAGFAVYQGAAPVCAQQSAPQPAPSASEATPKATPSPKALAAWRGKVLAHLNAHKRAVTSSPGGVSTVAFSIDRSGRVLSAQIVKSSGSSALDKEAVALTQRASPVPAPPSDFSGSKLYLKVPISFTH